MKIVKQENEIQCQDCDWWRERNGNTCVPRAITYVLSPINETAMPAHLATFADCPHKSRDNDEVIALLKKNKVEKP